MAFSWSTFILELINFLVLVWILKRFLYQPVLDVVEKRRADVAATLQSAHQKAQQAEELRQQFEARLTDWQNERQAKRDELTREIAQEWQQRLAQLDEELQQQRDKALSLAAEQASTERRDQQAEVIRHGGAFVSRLLDGLVDQSLHERLVRYFIQTLEASETQIPWQSHDGATEISITTAYPLTAATRNDLETILSRLVGDPAPNFNYATDEELIAGLSIELDGWALDANLRDELRAFAELDNMDHVDD
jgi:F-type H+-transporting ATPase subunit b